MSVTGSRPSSITAFLERLEQDPTLGRVAAAVAGPVTAAVGSGWLSDVLRGRALGHALHPLLVQVPLGAMLSATTLDLTQGARAEDQSRLLMGLTCLAVVPAAASGWAEWAGADERTRRVGIVHATLNVAAAVVSVASYVARRRGWSPTAAVLTGVAAGSFGAGGMLGGHLSLVRKYASHDRPSDDQGPRHGRYSD